MCYQISWTENTVVEVNSVEETDDLLNKLTSTFTGNPYLVVITAPNESSLTIGIGLSDTILGFTSGDLNFASLGDSDRVGILTFYYFGHHSEFLAKNAIPMSTAREGVRQYVKNGERPKNVAWEQI